MKRNSAFQNVHKPQMDAALKLEFRPLTGEAEVYADPKKMIMSSSKTPRQKAWHEHAAVEKRLAKVRAKTKRVI